MNVETKFASFNVPNISDQLFLVDATAGPVNVTFTHNPNCAYLVVVKKNDNSGNKVFLIAPAGHTFEGLSMIVLKSRYQSVALYHAHNDFYIISST